MNSTTPLSGEEVAAIMAELGDAEPPAGVPQPFALGREVLNPVAAMPGLDRIGERLARRMRSVIEPFARVKPQVIAEPVEVRKFESWRAELPSFTSLSLYRLRPMKGGMLMAIDPEFISRLVDSYYGGRGAGTTMRQGEFTATEERLLAKLAEGIIAELVDTWSEVLVMEPSLAARETNAAYASLVRGDEPVVVARFSIIPPAGEASAIDLVYPLGSLRSLESQLSAKVHDDGGPVDSAWRARMASALDTVRLPVKSVLARPTMSLADLMRLKPGDVIPIALSPRVPLYVGTKLLGEGVIGDKDGRVALKLEVVAKGQDR